MESLGIIILKENYSLSKNSSFLKRILNHKTKYLNYDLQNCKSNLINVLNSTKI